MIFHNLKMFSHVDLWYLPSPWTKTRKKKQKNANCEIVLAKKNVEKKSVGESFLCRRAKLDKHGPHFFYSAVEWIGFHTNKHLQSSSVSSTGNPIWTKERKPVQWFIFVSSIILFKWFQPIWKICSSTWIISPSRGRMKKYLKPPPRHRCG